MLAAYRHGIFPWFSAGQPILWWSPDPRMVLYVDEFRVAFAAQAHERGDFEMRVDSAFRDVIEQCAACMRSGQTRHLDHARDHRRLRELHRAGFRAFGRSWRDGELVGGLYGLALGRMFFGESMFAHETDASKVALVRLVDHVAGLGMPLIDCQQETAHLASFGARRSRDARLPHILAELIHSPTARRLALDAAAGPPRGTAGMHEQAQRPSAGVAAVLRDGAVSVQLPAGPRGALAGRDAQPPDRYAGLQRARAPGLSPQRRVHVPAVLRPLPRLRAGAGAVAGVQAQPHAAQACMRNHAQVNRS